MLRHAGPDPCCECSVAKQRSRMVKDVETRVTQHAHTRTKGGVLMPNEPHLLRPRRRLCRPQQACTHRPAGMHAPRKPSDPPATCNAICQRLALRPRGLNKRNEGEKALHLNVGRAALTIADSTFGDAIGTSMPAQAKMPLPGFCDPAPSFTAFRFDRQQIDLNMTDLAARLVRQHLIAKVHGGTCVDAPPFK